MKTTLYLLMFVVMAGFCFGAQYHVWTIPICYGDATILINSEKGESYKIVDWVKYSNHTWKYGCNGNNHSIILESYNNTKDVFDIRVQYYVEPFLSEDNDTSTMSANEIENEANKRVENIMNFAIGPRPQPFKFDFPEGTELMIYIIIFAAIIIVIIISIVMLYKRFMSERPDDSSDKGGNIDEPTEEEVEEFLKQMRGK